jgi:hypothetical protein
MNPEVKAKWVSALRSGKYQQGKHLLRPTENQFCCLGVLCDIAQQEMKGVWEDSEEHAGYYFLYDNSWGDKSSEDSELPFQVMEWAELMNENPKVTMNERNIKENYKDIIYTDSKISLAELNDTYGYNFNQLADIIEEQL